MKVKNLTMEAILLLLFLLVNFINAAFRTGVSVYFFLIVLFAIYAIRNARFYYKLNRFFYVYLLYMLVLVFQGIFNNNFNNYLYYDVIAFSCIFLVLISLRFNTVVFYTKFLPQLGVYINIIAISFSLYHLVVHGINIASIEEGRGLDDIGEGELMSPKYYLNVSFFLYPLVVYIRSKPAALLYHISIGMFIFFSLAMGSRGTTTAGIVVFVLTYLRSRNVDSRALFSANFLKYLSFICIGFLVAYQIPAVRVAADYLIFRFTSEDIGASRTEEAWEIYSNFTFNELIFGKGLGAANTYWIFSDVLNGVNNAHYGWMFLILKGGILLAVFIYTKIVFSIVRLSQNSLLSPYAITLIGFLLLEYAHTNFNNFLNLSFMFIALFATRGITKNANGN